MKKGDKVPQIKFRVRELGEWIDTNSDTYFRNKRVILFSLPGAFTPTCSLQQLPGFEKLHNVFKEHKVDDVYCLSVNDSFVMNAWAQNQKLENVKVIPDGNGEFTDAMDMLVEKRDRCFGMRSWRYAAIVENCEIIEHDCLIEDFCHISPGCSLGGETVIHELSWIGIGSSVKHGINIGKRVTIGAGSVVIKDIPSECTAYGVPCEIA